MTNFAYESYRGGSPQPNYSGITAPSSGVTQPSPIPRLSSAAIDFLYSQATAEGASLGDSNGPLFETFNVPSEPHAIGWKLTVTDARGGLNRTVGDFNRDYDRAYSSSLETRGYKNLILPALTTVATTPDPSTNNADRMSAAFVFGALMIGAGTTSASQLFTESSTGVISASASYNVGFPITFIGPAVTGGATTAERLIVHHTGAVPRVVSATAGTIDGSMTNVTAPSWGHIQTPLNDNAIIFYHNGQLSTLTQSSAITGTPTARLTVRNGGWPMGILSLGGSRLRAWWAFPKAGNLTSSAIGYNQKSPVEVWSTNLEAGDPQPLYMGFNAVFAAGLARNGIWAIDFNQDRITFHDGRTLKDLGFKRDRAPNSDKVLKLQGAWAPPDSSDIYVAVNEIASTNGTGDTRFWVEAYNLMYGTWHQVTAATQLSTTGRLIIPAAGSLPFSSLTNNIHSYNDGSWYRNYTPPFGVDLFSLRQSSGAQSTTGIQYASSGTWTSPYWTLPGNLSNHPSLITNIVYHGDAQAGGSGCNIAISAGGVSANFVNRSRRQPQVASFEGNNSTFYELQVAVTITQGSSTYMTPNVLPFTVYGVTWLDEQFLPDQPAAPR